MDMIDVIPVKFNGTNYLSSSFHLKNFVEGQGMLGYLDGTTPKPVAGTAATSTTPVVDDKIIATWNQHNAKVITSILNSVDPSFSMALQAFTMASDMWKHMKKIYHQQNKARRFHLDIEFARYCQNDKSVQEYYNGFLALWTERDQMLLQYVSAAFLPQALKLHEEQHVGQFLMNLRSEFEPIQAALMNREIYPDLDTCVQEVLREETRLLSTHSLNAKQRHF